MREFWFEIFVHVPGSPCGNDWECAKRGNMTRGAAEGLFAQFARTYQTRMFRGREIGRLVKSNVICNEMGRPDFPC